MAVDRGRQLAGGGLVMPERPQSQPSEQLAGRSRAALGGQALQQRLQRGGRHGGQAQALVGGRAQRRLPVAGGQPVLDRRIGLAALGQRGRQARVQRAPARGRPLTRRRPRAGTRGTAGGSGTCGAPAPQARRNSPRPASSSSSPAGRPSAAHELLVEPLGDPGVEQRLAQARVEAVEHLLAQEGARLVELGLDEPEWPGRRRERHAEHPPLGRLEHALDLAGARVARQSLAQQRGALAGVEREIGRPELAQAAGGAQAAEPQRQRAARGDRHPQAGRARVEEALDQLRSAARELLGVVDHEDGGPGQPSGELLERRAGVARVAAGGQPHREPGGGRPGRVLQRRGEALVEWPRVAAGDPGRTPAERLDGGLERHGLAVAGLGDEDDVGVVLQRAGDPPGEGPAGDRAQGRARWGGPHISHPLARAWPGQWGFCAPFVHIWPRRRPVAGCHVEHSWSTAA